MAKSKYNLLVVAHPDDETIFFGALLLKRRGVPWHVICTTDGNADGQGKKRRRQFTTACGLLKVKQLSWLGFPDVFARRLDTARLSEHLRALPRPNEVFTHGIVGEYGHPHHQDVSFAVHEAFAESRPVYSTAYNCFPDFTVQLSPKQYELKTRILSHVYGSETRRFANLLPATATEGFTRVALEEVRALYRYFVSQKSPPGGSLETYKWLWPYLKSQGDVTKRRLF